MNGRMGQYPLGKCVSLIKSPMQRKEFYSVHLHPYQTLKDKQEGSGLMEIERLLFAHSIGCGSSQTFFFLFEIFVWNVFSNYHFSVHLVSY